MVVVVVPMRRDGRRDRGHAGAQAIITANHWHNASIQAVRQVHHHFRQISVMATSGLLELEHSQINQSGTNIKMIS